MNMNTLNFQSHSSLEVRGSSNDLMEDRSTCKKGFDDNVMISLHQFEQENIALESPITTATWFEGDIQDAAVTIKNRVREILEVNPWLTGKLVKGSRKKGLLKKDIKLVYSNNDDGISDVVVNKIFRFCSIHDIGSFPDIHLGMALRDVFTSLVEFRLVVKKSSSLVDSNDAIFNVSILPDSMKPDKRFILVVSLCHRAADGCNFYSIYNMLNPARPVIALNPHRKLEVVKEIESLMGCPMMDGVGGLWVTILFIREIIRSKMKGEQYVSKMFFLNKSFLNDQKKTAASLDNVSFVSTNDIVTSNFFNICNTDQGFMTVNFRSRVTDCQKTDAGNYFNTIRYRPQDFATPALIRKSINNPSKFSRAADPRTEALPNTPDLLKLCPHLSISTNWSSYYDDEFCLDDKKKKNGVSAFKELLHVPLKDMRYTSPSLMSNCTLFKMWPGQQAVCITATPERVAKFALSEMVDKSTEDRVSEEMLPYFMTSREYETAYN